MYSSYCDSCDYGCCCDCNELRGRESADLRERKNGCCCGLSVCARCDSRHRDRPPFDRPRMTIDLSCSYSLLFLLLEQIAISPLFIVFHSGNVQNFAPDWRQK